MTTGQGFRLLVLLLFMQCCPLFRVVAWRSEAVEDCAYNPLTDKPFPYPYDKHHWFQALRRAYQRAPPVRLRKLVTSAEPGKVSVPLHVARFREAITLKSFLMGNHLESSPRPLFLRAEFPC